MQYGLNGRGGDIMALNDLGYTWTKMQAVAPALVTAMRHQVILGRRSRMISHALWVLDYSDEPGEKIRVGSQKNPWRERAGRVAHLYPPGLPYWEDTLSLKKTVQCAYVLFTGGELAGLDDFTNDRRSCARFFDSEGRIERLLIEAANAGARLGENGYWLAQGAFCSLLHLMKMAERRDEEYFVIPRDEPVSSEFVLAVKEYFRQHLADKVTVGAVARHMHMSVSAMAHRYRAEAGEPPMSGLLSMRINMAKTLLLRGERLQAIAAHTGFYDAFHFSRTFKRAFGMSPKAFLHSIKNTTD